MMRGIGAPLVENAVRLGAAARVSPGRWPQPGSDTPRLGDADASHPLSLIELGVTPYSEAMALQERLVRERLEGRRPDTLVLLEHPHVVTVGRGFNGRTLGRTPHPVVHADRGGDVTYHGPGQIVGYPIVHLGERGIRIGPYLRLLEEVLIDAVAGFGLRGERLKGFTGVWCRGKKLASIGIGVRGWVAFHGFALNASPDLAQLKGLHPCGLEPGSMTSMEALLGRAPGRGAVLESLARAFRARFLAHA